MADIEMPPSVPCQFDKAWVGACKKPSTNGWCSEHEHLVCASCGAKAVRECERTNGSFCCGFDLCKTCTHSSHGDEHVTAEVYQAQRDQEKREKEASIASRMSAEVRMHPELGVPLNLFELLKSNPRECGFELSKIYFLELKHGMMAFFPAIFSADTDRIVMTSDLRILERVWELLEPRRAGIVKRVAYIHSTRGVAYIDADSQEEREDSKPYSLLRSSEEISKLLEQQLTPFCWAPGLIGDGRLSIESYMRNFSAQAAELDPSFKSAYCAA